MAARAVMNAKNPTTGEYIYFKGHAKATYMSDGRNVEEYINDVMSDSNKTLVEFTNNSITLEPNKYYRQTLSTSSLTIKLGNVVNDGILNEYFIEFTTAVGGTTISLPSTIKWANGEKPTFDINSTYQISIVNNLGVCVKFV